MAGLPDLSVKIHPTLDPPQNSWNIIIGGQRVTWYPIFIYSDFIFEGRMWV